MNGERHITLNGNSQYFEYVENYMNGTGGRTNHGSDGKIPGSLDSSQGRSLLGNLQKHGVLDEHFQPMELSTSESAVLAYQVCAVLSIKNVWKVFSALWGTSANVLRAAYNRGMDQKKTMKFLDEINPFLKI